MIAGDGLTGAKAADAPREQGFRSTITLIAAEVHLPYERPPLSESYLSGGSAFDEAIILARTPTTCCTCLPGRAPAPGRSIVIHVIDVA